MASELLRIRVRADAGNTQGVLSDVSRSLLGLSVGAAGARSGMLGMAAALGGAQITGRLASAAVGALGFSAFSAAGAMLTATGQVEQFRVNLGALVKDRPLVDAMVSSIEGFASRTAFANQAVFEVAQNLVAARVPLQNLLPTLQMLGDVSLGNAEKFSGIATAWTQIISKGKITAEEINQIAERGVSVWAILAEETGKSVPELQKLAETGKLTVSTFLPILQAGLAKRYAGSLAEASKLSTNLATNITKSITTFAAVIGGGLESTVNPFMAELARLFQRAALYARALVASQLWQRFTQSLQAAADALMPIIRALGVSTFIALIRAVQALTPLMWMLAAAFRGIAAAAQALFRYFKPLFDMFRRLAQTIKSLNWQGLWQAIKDQSSDLASRIGAILMEVIKAALLWAQNDMVPTLRAFAGKMLDDIAAYIKEHPVQAFAIAVGAWVVRSLPAIITAVRGSGAGGMILGALIGGLDVKAGLEQGDWGRVGQGLVEILVGVIVARAKGGVFGLAAAAIAGAIYTDIQDVINKEGQERSQAIWQLIADGLIVAAVAIPWPALLIRALSPIGTAIIGAISGAIQVASASIGLILLGLRAVFVTWAATAGTWLLGLGSAILSGLSAAWAALSPAAIVAGLILVLAGAVVAIIARLIIGIRDGDWVSIGSALLAALALGVAVFIGGIPALFIGAVVAIITALFGPALLEGLVAAWNRVIDYFSNASVETLSNWVISVGAIIAASMLTIAALLLAGVSAPVIAIGAVAAALIAGLIAGLTLAWDDVTTWLSEKWTWFIQTSKEFLGISSPSTVMADIGADIIAGLWKGLEDTWHTITQWLSTFWTTIKEAFNTHVIALGVALKEYATALWAMLVQGFEGMWSGAVAGVALVWTTITNWVRSQIESIGDTIKSMAGSVGTSMYEMFTAAWEGIKGRVQGIIDGIKSMISSAFTGATTGAQSAASQSQASQRIARENFYKNMGDTPSEAARKAAQEYPGFANGGSFRVGGFGGVDSQLVAFRATPGENVQISRPGQSQGINVGTINVYANDYEGGVAAARAIRDALGMQRQMLFLTT